jgi:HEAT repeat protein
MSLRFALLVISLSNLILSCHSNREQSLAALQSTRPEERANAVKALAQRYAVEDLGLFTQAAKDPSPLVRAEAMFALSKSQDSRVVDLLGEGLGDTDESVQRAAATALALTKTDKAKAYLTRQYAYRGRDTRYAIAEGLKASNVPGAMASAVAAESSVIWERNLRALTEGAVPEKVSAAEELGRSGRPEAVNRLVGLLNDPHPLLAAAAARGLGFAREARSVSALQLVFSRNDPRIRDAACEALTRLKDPAALPKLREIALERSTSSALALKGILALPESEESNRALCDITFGGAEAEAHLAGRAMRQRGGCPLDSVIEKLKSASTQAAALTAIANLGSSAATLAPKVVPLLAAADVHMRRLAADALAELKDQSQATAVLKALDAEIKNTAEGFRKWVPDALPLQFDLGYDPRSPALANDPMRVVQARQSDLFRRVLDLREQRAKAAGRVTLNYVAPADIIDDASEAQLQALIALIHAATQLNAPGIKERILPLTGSSVVALRASVFAGLSTLGELTLARPGLYDPDRPVRVETARALIQQGPDGCVTVASTAAELVSERGDLLQELSQRPLPKAAVEKVLPVLSEGGAEATWVAGMAAEAKMAEAAPALQKLLSDQTQLGRREIMLSWSKIAGPEAKEMLVKELYSDSADIRVAAIRSLAIIEKGVSLEALDALKGDYFLEVREAASGALKK